jgi:hypothetical protein
MGSVVDNWVDVFYLYKETNSVILPTVEGVECKIVDFDSGELVP